jgi:hypothetical protein
VLSVLTSPSSGECVPEPAGPEAPVPFFCSQVIGVSNAPPSDSSDPRVDASVGVEAGLPHETESGSMDEVPFERIVKDEGSGIAGGKGKMLAPDVTWTTRSRAWR